MTVYTVEIATHGCKAEIDGAKLAPEMVERLIRKGLSAATNNEVTSSVTAAVRRKLAEVNGGKAADVPSADVKVWRETHAADYTAMIREEFSAQVADILSGEYGTREPAAPRAPKYTPVESVARELLAAAIAAKMPPGTPAKTLRASLDTNWSVEKIRNHFTALGEAEHKRRQAAAAKMLGGEVELAL